MMQPLYMSTREYFCCSYAVYMQYVFLTVEAMVDAAVHMGLPRAMATKLVNKTVKVRNPKH
jgi:hypothetical protein